MRRLDASASNIARAGSEGVVSGVDLGGEMVEHLAAKQGALANLAVMRTSDALERHMLELWG